MRFTKAQKETLDIQEICAFCEHASPLRSTDEMLCRIHGVVTIEYSCRHFRYDLLKRKPPKKASLPLLKTPLPTLEDEDAAVHFPESTNQ